MKISEALDLVKTKKVAKNKNIKDLLNTTFLAIQKMIDQRSGTEIIKEEEEEKGLALLKKKELKTADTKALSLGDKRKMLKEIYGKTLTAMGMKDNIKFFNRLIDNVPEHYLDYELKINTPAAGAFVKDLIDGNGQMTIDELRNVINVIKDVGVPVLTKVATDEHKLSPEDAKIGADHIDSNVREYLASKAERLSPRNKIAAPGTKDLIATANTTDLETIKRNVLAVINKDLIIPDSDREKFRRSKIGKIASQLRSPGMNVKGRLDHVAEAIQKAKDYKEANEELKKKAIEVEFKSQDEYNDFLSKVLSKEAKVKEKVGRKPRRR